MRCEIIARRKDRQMATQPLVERLSPAYVDESRYERIDGRLVPRPLPGDIHSDIQENVRRLVSERGKELGFKARSEWSVTRPDMVDQEEPDYLTPDVLVAHQPYARTKRGHLIPPGFLAVEITSPNQDGLFQKAQMLRAWGVEHVWIINPQTGEAFEYHGGNQFTLVHETLSAGEILVQLPEVWAAISE